MRFDVFVSSESIALGPAASLVQSLRERGFSVVHSPPWDSEKEWHGEWNPDWNDWYGPNLARTIEEARVVVAVISSLWQASSWMLTECLAAAKKHSPRGHMKPFFWNPQQIPITNPNFSELLGEELPQSLDEAVRALGKLLVRSTNGKEEQ